MESPLQIGDITTNSILNRLDGTHILATTTAINQATYLGQLFIQLVVHTNKQEFAVLRRIEDSYVNATQLMTILVGLQILTSSQVDKFLSNEVLTNSQYQGTIKQYNDFRNHENPAIRGIWISYDKAVSLAVKFDIYELSKSLFLIDVHEYEELPKGKRVFEEHETGSDILESPAKKLKTDKVFKNTNFPFTLPPIEYEDEDLINDFKSRFGQVFKDDNDKLSFEEIKKIFAPCFEEYNEFIDIPLDAKGQTALHFAATLASSTLVGSFVDLGLNSPIRGNIDGESPLVASVQVTNAMEKGNFTEILTNWLHPNLWLLDSKSQTIYHHLAIQSIKKAESVKFYTTKILEFITSNDRYLHDTTKLINKQDDQGNTCLHLAVQNESKWLIKLFLLMKADPQIANKIGVKPIDLVIVKESQKFESNDQIFELLRTALEFFHDRLEINSEIPEIDPIKHIKTIEKSKVNLDNNSTNSSSIFQSIQDLLSNTNNEYELILNTKREQILNLQKALHDSTIVTANNRYTLKSISEKLADLDNIKLQMANINDKLQSSKKEIPELKDSNYNEEENFDADEPFIIEPLFEKVLNNESLDELKTDEFVSQLQPSSILKARVDAYKQINQNLESELNTLLNYSELTSKFKKIVSICTGVDINEVDEYLDGLLEAVEVQQ